MVNHMTRTHEQPWPTDVLSKATSDALIAGLLQVLPSPAALRTPKYLAWRAEFIRASEALNTSAWRLAQERARYGAGHESKLALRRHAEAEAEVARLTAVDVVESSAKPVGR